MRPPVLLGSLLFSVGCNVTLLLALLVHQHLSSGCAPTALPSAFTSSSTRNAAPFEGSWGRLASTQLGNALPVVVVLARHDEDLGFVSTASLGPLQHVQVKVFATAGGNESERLTDATARRALAAPTRVVPGVAGGAALHVFPVNRGREAMAYLTGARRQCHGTAHNGFMGHLPPPFSAQR